MAILMLAVYMKITVIAVVVAAVAAVAVAVAVVERAGKRSNTFKKLSIC